LLVGGEERFGVERHNGFGAKKEDRPVHRSAEEPAMSARMFSFGRRIRDLQKGAPYRLEVYAAIPGSLNDEKQLHRRFIRHRTNIGEWFHYSDEIKDYINSFRVAVAAE